MQHVLLRREQNRRIYSKAGCKCQMCDPTEDEWSHFPFKSGPSMGCDNRRVNTHGCPSGAIQESRTLSFRARRRCTASRRCCHVTLTSLYLPAATHATATVSVSCQPSRTLQDVGARVHTYTRLLLLYRRDVKGAGRSISSFLKVP